MRAVIHVGAGLIFVILVFVGAPFWAFGELNRGVRYVMTGHNDGQGLGTLPYILRGRRDLWGDFLGSLLLLGIGVSEWVLAVRWLVNVFP